MIGNFGQHYPNNPAKDAQVQSWYNHPWDAVLRPTNKELAALSANMQIAACNNNNIIYIWGGTTYHSQLAANGYDPSAIKVQCGTDCMGSVYANVKGACKKLGIDCSGIPDLGTFYADTLVSKLGYKKFTDYDHVATDAHAERGDVYVQYATHAAMYVGNGQYSDSSSSGSSESSSGSHQTSDPAVILNLEKMSPYIVVVPESDTSFDCKSFKAGQISGVALHAGYLYDHSTHSKKSQYIAKNLHKQADRCKQNGMPFALVAEVRARTVGEAESELEKLYYVCASRIPDIGLWLHLDFPSGSSKSSNDRVLKKYLEECSKWGYKNSLGVYATDKELSRVTWSDFSDDMYFWKVDHNANIDKYVGVIPFAKYTTVTVETSPPSSGSSDGGESGSSSSDSSDESVNSKQRAIVNACKTTASPGAGYCAAWITWVYMNAGVGHPGGNACDMYYQYCKYSSRSDLKVGMLVAVPSYPDPYSDAGRIYGHVAIYIGNGLVMENIGNINTQSLDDWISYYGGTHTPKWGFGASGIA